MIAHVAAAGEERGRVILRLTHDTPHPVALAAAMCVAQAFHAEIESLFVEDLALFELASFPFAREISFSGRRSSALSPEGIAADMRYVAASFQRTIGALAERAEIPFRATVIRDEPVAAVARACARCGPWNVVALAEPISAASPAMLSQLFASVVETTGVVVVGPNAKRTAGPIIAVVEDIAHLEPMLRTAERLHAVTAAESLQLLLIGAGDDDTMEMEGQARLVLGDNPVATIIRVNVPFGAAIDLAERLRRAGGGFILARFGGLLVPREGNLAHLVQSLECPLFLMR